MGVSDAVVGRKGVGGRGGEVRSNLETKKNKQSKESHQNMPAFSIIFFLPFLHVLPVVVGSRGKRTAYKNRAPYTASNALN